MDIDVQSIIGFQHERGLHCVFVKKCFSMNFLCFPPTCSINLTQICSIIGEFIGIIISGNPECFVIATHNKLCQLLTNDKMIELILFWKFVPESDTIIKYTENHIERNA